MTKPDARCARCGRPARSDVHRSSDDVRDPVHAYEPPDAKPDRMLLKQVLAQYIADGQIVPPQEWRG